MSSVPSPVRLIRKHWRLVLGTALLFVASIGVAAAYSPAFSSNGDTASDKHTAVYVLSLIGALHSYYADTQESEPSETGIAKDTTILIEDNDNLVAGNAYIEPYLNDPNPLIQSSAASVYQAANSMIQANDVILQDLKDVSYDYDGNAVYPPELSYDTANATAVQNEAYNDMINAVASIASLIRESPSGGVNPTSGPIPYLLPSDERNDLLSALEVSFPDLTGSCENNDYLLMACGIYLYSAPDTYEQLSAEQTAFMPSVGTGN